MTNKIDKINMSLTKELVDNIRLLNRIDGDYSLTMTVEKALTEYVERNKVKIDKFNEIFNPQKEEC